MTAGQTAVLATASPFPPRRRGRPRKHPLPSTKFFDNSPALRTSVPYGVRERAPPYGSSLKGHSIQPAARITQLRRLPSLHGAKDTVGNPRGPELAAPPFASSNASSQPTGGAVDAVAAPNSSVSDPTADDGAQNAGTKHTPWPRAPTPDLATAPASATTPALMKCSAPELWKHLAQTDGVITPIHEREEARFGWARFFLNMGIDPLVARLRDRGSPENVNMAIDGQVLCHIANLYSLGGDDAHHPQRGTGIMSDGRCDTSLGVFEWSAGPDNSSRIRVSCTPRHFRAAMRHSVRPFHSIPLLPNRKALDVYTDTLTMGVSDPSFEWPAYPAPLARWINAMAKNLVRLSARRPEQGCVVVTPTWLEIAKFARWLMCFDGRSSRGFFQDVVREIDRRDFICLRARGFWAQSENHPRSGPQEEQQEHQDDTGVRNGPVGKFLINAFAQTLVSTTNYRLVDEDDPAQASKAESLEVRSAAAEILTKVLTSYGGEAANSWKRTLFECRDAVCGILTAGFEVPVHTGAVVVLPFDMESGLWEMRDIPVTAT